MILKISKLIYYPVKGAGGISVESATALSSGLWLDRDFMFVDSEGRFASQRNTPLLSQLKLQVDSENLSLKFPNLSETFEIQLAPDLSLAARQVKVWKDTVSAWDLGDKVARLASSAFGRELRMVRVKSDQMRVVDPLYSDNSEVEHSFADGYPYLIISEASLDDLNRRLSEGGYPAIDMDRFRPNIVLSGTQTPFIEDQFQRLTHADFEFILTKPCTRCQVVNVNQQTAIASQQTLKTLMAYRFNEQLKGATFGMNALLRLTKKGANRIQMQIGESIRAENPL